MDVSLTGWGAVSSGLRTGGPRCTGESQWHINYLELLAAFLAVQTFAKQGQDLTIALSMDVSALTYINKTGETKSPSLSWVVKECCTWCVDHNIKSTVEHIPGVTNGETGEESGLMKDRYDCMINLEVLTEIDLQLGRLTTDLFASQLSHQLP